MEVKQAVITGASSGIGESYARTLAGQGCSLVLIARREDKLNALAEELRNKHSVNVDVWRADLSSEEDVRLVAQRLKERQVDLLINNAGFGSGKGFLEIEVEKLRDMVHVHTTATIYLCQAVLPEMVKRDSGAIINVASVAGLIPVPGSLVYSGTKAFLVFFSESMQKGLGTKNVRIQALCPGYTYTSFHDTPAYQDFKRSSIPNFLWMNSEDVVRISLDALNRTKTTIIPGFANRLIVWLLRCPLTEGFMRALFRRTRKR